MSEVPLFLQRQSLTTICQVLIIWNLKKATAALKEMDMDELTAVRSSFKTAEIAGLSKQKLLQAAEHYLKVLDKEKKSVF
jgi:hypothetical protein